MERIPEQLADQALVKWPLPVAQAVMYLDSATNIHEQRDRVVETFRVTLRVLASFVLAVRLHHGVGPDDEAPQVAQLLDRLGSRQLTDGQWFGLTRDIARAWGSAPQTHPLPDLIHLFHGRKSSRFIQCVEGLLQMRKSETVAHGATGKDGELHELLGRRLPQLAKFLTAAAVVWRDVECIIPLAVPVTTSKPREALRFSGSRPSSGRWRRRVVASSDTQLPAGRAVLVRTDGTPVLSLYPIVSLTEGAQPHVVELLFWDGCVKGQGAFITLPGMVMATDGDAWARIQRGFYQGRINVSSSAGVEEHSVLKRIGFASAAVLLASSMLVGGWWLTGEGTLKPTKWDAKTEQIRQQIDGLCPAQAEECLALQWTLLQRFTRQDLPLEPAVLAAFQAAWVPKVFAHNDLKHRALQAESVIDVLPIKVRSGPAGHNIWVDVGDEAKPLLKSDQVRELEEGGSAITAAVAIDEHRVVSGHFDGKVRIWNRQTGEELSVETHSAVYQISAVGRDTEEARFWTGVEGDKSVFIWNANTGELLEKGGAIGRGKPDEISLSAENVVTLENGVPLIWDLSGSRSKWAPDSDGAVYKTVLAPGGSQLLGYLRQGGVQVWELLPEPERKAQQLLGDGQGVLQIVYAADMSELAILDANMVLHRWDPKEFRTLLPLSLGKEKKVTRIAYAGARPNLHLALRHFDGTTSVWDTLNGERLGEEPVIYPGAGTSFPFALSPRAKWVATGVRDQVHLWALEAPSSTKDLSHGADVVLLEFSRAAQHILTATTAGNVVHWNIETGKRGQTLSIGHDILAMRWFDETRVVVIGKDGVIRLWNVKYDKPEIQWPALDGQPLAGASFAGSGDVNRFIVWSDKGARLWNGPFSSNEELLQEYGRKRPYRVCKDSLKVVQDEEAKGKPEQIWADPAKCGDDAAAP